MFSDLGNHRKSFFSTASSDLVQHPHRGQGCSLPHRNRQRLEASGGERWRKGHRIMLSHNHSLCYGRYLVVSGDSCLSNSKCVWHSSPPNHHNGCHFNQHLQEPWREVAIQQEVEAKELEATRWMSWRNQLHQMVQFSMKTL